MNSVPKLKDILTFDNIYMEICEELNSSKTSEQLLQKLNLASNDRSRIKIIIEQNASVMDIFTKNISDQYSPKNQQEAEVLIPHFNSCSNIEPLKLRLINEALRLCPYLNQDNLPGRNYILKPTLSYFLNLTTDIVKNAENANFLMPGLYLTRAKYFHDIGNYKRSILDVFRSLHSGAGLEKSYDVALLLGQCYIGLERFNEAHSIFQHSLQLLRTSGLDNECKSKETVKIVKILKDIQPKVKGQGQGGSNDSAEELCIKASSVEDTSVVKRFPIFEGKNERLNGSSNVLELRYNEQRGRHIIANKFIPPGATLIVEYPYIWSLNPKNFEKLCQFCMKSAENGVPCPTCSSVIFCNEDCLQQALNLFHRSECKILKLLICSEKLGNMALLCFRTIIRTPFAVIAAEFEKHHSELESSTLIPENGRLDSSTYESVFAQTTNSIDRSGPDLLKRSYAAIYLTLCLRYVGYFGAARNLSLDINFCTEELLISAVLLRHLQSVSCNAYGINLASSRPEKFAPLEIEEVGGGSYPIISTTNHSCTPNAYRLNMGKFCIVKSIREISPGEEVLDSYGPLHTISALEDRLSELENQYLFTCTCSACHEDWPTFAVLKNRTTPKKCPNCSGIGVIPTTSKENGKCSTCGKSSDVKKIHKLVENAQNKYLKAKQEILSSDFVDDKSLSKNAKSICEYISSCRKILSNPSKEVIEAQEMLKLVWNMMAISEEI